MSETCPVCGEPCLSIGSWHESKDGDSDEFRTIVHDRDGMFVTESCTETR